MKCCKPCLKISSPTIFYFKLFMVQITINNRSYYTEVHAKNRSSSFSDEPLSYQTTLCFRKFFQISCWQIITKYPGKHTGSIFYMILLLPVVSNRIHQRLHILPLRQIHAAGSLEDESAAGRAAVDQQIGRAHV